MKKILREIEVVAGSFLDAPTWAQYLLEKAVEARRSAYCPYSEYAVGSALMSVEGKVYSGCNVERATYSETTHAEQAAIDSMVRAEGRSARISRIAIVGAPEPQLIGWDVRSPLFSTYSDVGSPSCGRCLQCIWEHCEGDSLVELAWTTPNGAVAITTIGDSFPLRFGPEDLGL